MEKTNKNLMAVLATAVILLGAAICAICLREEGD